MTDTTQATDPTVAPLTDPTTLRDVDGVDYLTTERVDDAEHFERHEATAGFAAVAVTNDDGALALTETGPVWILPHASVEPGGDFVDFARRAADDLLGLDVTIDRVVRARRKDCTLEDPDREHHPRRGLRSHPLLTTRPSPTPTTSRAVRPTPSRGSTTSRRTFPRTRFGRTSCTSSARRS